jgi:hypothetical protein
MKLRSGYTPVTPRAWNQTRLVELLLTATLTWTYLRRLLSVDVATLS